MGFYFAKFKKFILAVISEIKLEAKQEVQDVDLRSASAIHKTISSSTILPAATIPTPIATALPKALDSIKRLSTDKSLDEPIPKKCKSENLDE